MQPVLRPPAGSAGGTFRRVARTVPPQLPQTPEHATLPPMVSHMFDDRAGPPQTQEPAPENDPPDAPGAGGFRASDALDIAAPGEQRVPVVFASPHSGRDYPESFLAASRLDAIALRQSEDAFVDELFASVTECGAPLIRALFPRAFIDVNREAFELDPAMFEDKLPAEVNSTSARVNAGLGTIARVVSNGQEIYGRRLKFADASRRIDACYRPYHRALQALIAKTVERFGGCLLIDCHSMPSLPVNQRGGIFDTARSRAESPPDLVFGDCWGRACDAAVSRMVDAAAKAAGFTTRRNIPYAGGFTTRHYGRPSTGVHALQIEIRRDLYMNEDRVERNADFETARDRIGDLARRICEAAAGVLDDVR